MIEGLILLSGLALVITMIVTKSFVPSWVMKEAVEEEKRALARVLAVEKKWDDVVEKRYNTEFPEFNHTRVRPRKREQWWIDLWLDSWKRQVGSAYEPLKGDADFVEPDYVDMSELSADDFKKKFPTPVMGGQRRLTQRQILDGNFSEGFKEYARQNSHLYPDTAAVDHVSARMPKATEEERVLRMVEHGVITAQQANRAFDYLMSVRQEMDREPTLREQIDPTGYLNDYQYEKVERALLNAGHIRDNQYCGTRRDVWNVAQVLETRPRSSYDVYRQAYK